MTTKEENIGREVQMYLDKEITWEQLQKLLRERKDNGATRTNSELQTKINA